MIINFLRRLSVRRRIVGGFAILLAILAVSIPLIVVNHLTLANRVQQLANVESKSDRLLLLSLSRVLSSRVNLMRYSDDLTPSVSEALNDISQAVQHIEEARTLITTPEQKTAMAKILAGMVSYSTLISNVQSASEENRLQDVPVLLSNSYQLEFDIEQQIRAVAANNEARVDEVNKAALADAQQRLALLISVYAVLLLLAVATAFFIQQSITNPISELRQGIEEFRLYRKETAIPSEGLDELSFLAKAFNQITAELSQVFFDLEQRVANRTKALTTSTEVSRRLSTILNKKELVSEVVKQVKDAFNYYHAHIYLVDETSGDLIMAGGTGEAGATMLARGHKVQKGRGLVGRAAETNAPVLVSDTLSNPDWLPNPLLPETNAEAAVPISIGPKVLGILDVQHNLVNGLDQEDVNLLQSIANQIGIALQNARIFAEAEQQRLKNELILKTAGEGIFGLDENGNHTFVNPAAVEMLGFSMEELIGKHSHTLWHHIHADGTHFPEDECPIYFTLKDGTPHQGEEYFIRKDGSGFYVSFSSIPILENERAIGAVVTFADITQQRQEREFTARRARQQETLNLITQKIQNSTSVDAALKVAARELGHALGMKPTLVALDPKGLAGEHRENINN